jgi:hypothetical protein
VRPVAGARVSWVLNTRRGRLTKGDQVMLRWLDRVGWAGAEELAQRFKRPTRVVRRRMRLARAHGLAGYARLMHGEPGIYLAPGARVSPRLWAHSLGVTRLVVAYELAGWRVVTERELRVMREAGVVNGWVLDLGSDRAGR